MEDEDEDEDQNEDNVDGATGGGASGGQPSITMPTQNILSKINSVDIIDNHMVDESMEIFHDGRVSCQCCDVVLSIAESTRVSPNVKMDYNLLCIIAQCIPMTASSVILLFDSFHRLLVDSNMTTVSNRIISYWHVFYHFFFNECYEQRKWEWLPRDDINHARDHAPGGGDDDGDDDDDQNDNEEAALVNMETKRVLNLLFHRIHSLMRLDETLAYATTFQQTSGVNATIDESVTKLTKHGIFNTRTRCCIRKSPLCDRRRRRQQQQQHTPNRHSNDPAPSAYAFAAKADKQCSKTSSFLRDKLSCFTRHGGLSQAASARGDGGVTVAASSAAAIVVVPSYEKHRLQCVASTISSHLSESVTTTCHRREMFTAGGNNNENTRNISSSNMTRRRGRMRRRRRLSRDKGEENARPRSCKTAAKPYTKSNVTSFRTTKSQ